MAHIEASPTHHKNGLIKDKTISVGHKDGFNCSKKLGINSVIQVEEKKSKCWP